MCIRDRAYTTQIVAFIMIALDFGLKKGTITKEEYMNYIEELKAIPCLLYTSKVCFSNYIF